MCRCLLNLFVRGVLPARVAEFRRFEPVLMLLPVLRGRVVAVLTIAALECDDFSHGRLLDDLGDSAGAHRVAALANGEPQSLLERYRRDQRNLYRYIVPRHHHLHSVRERRHPRHVRGPEVELRPVSFKEGRVPPTFFLR